MNMQQQYGNHLLQRYICVETAEEVGTIHPAWWLKAELEQNFSHPVHLTFGSQGSNILVILFISAWLYWNYVTNVYIFNIKQYKKIY